MVGLLMATQSDTRYFVKTDYRDSRSFSFPGHADSCPSK